MRLIIGIALSMLFCLPTTASAQYRLTEKQAKRAIASDVAWIAGTGYFLAEAGHTSYCDEPLSRLKRRCFVKFGNYVLICSAGFTVEARPHRNRHVLVTKTRWNTCSDDQ